MALTLSQFITKYNGKKLDYDQYFGAQCVDLVQYWVRNLGYPPFWGNAVDIIRQAGSNYKRINRTSTNYPLAGDVVVWGGQLGHTSVAISGTKSKFTSFDQNWPPGSTAHKQGHYYNNVLGWLRPKVLIKKEVGMTEKEARKYAFTEGYAAITNKHATIGQKNTFLKSGKKPRAYLRSKFFSPLLAKIAKQTADEYQIAINKLNEEIDSMVPYKEYEEKQKMAIDLSRLVNSIKDELKIPYTSTPKVVLRALQSLIASKKTAVKKPSDDLLPIVFWRSTVTFCKFLKDLFSGKI